MQGLNDYITIKEWDELQQYSINELVDVYFKKHNRRLSKNEFENRMARMNSLGVTARIRFREEYAKRVVGPVIEEEIKAHPDELHFPKSISERLGINEIQLNSIGSVMEKIGANINNDLIYLVVNDNEKALKYAPECAAALRQGRSYSKARCFECYCNTRFCPKNSVAKSL